MTERTRCPVAHVPESDVVAWWEAGWTYVGPAPNQDFCIMQWDRPSRPVQPIGDEEMLSLRRAVSNLEGRIQ